MTCSLQHKICGLLASLERPAGTENLIVAASGGPDSTALLHLTAGCRERCAFKAIAVYIDHNLRPAEAPAEEAFVRRLAADLDMGFIVRRVETPQLAQSRGLSLEHAARELRYAVLEEEAKRHAAYAILLGHTQDDQVEGVLLRMLRGGGRGALAGMHEIQGLKVRPLLHTPKSELLAFLRERGLSYCLDSSNADDRFLRNRIRHHLLPLLEAEYDPGVRRALLKTADVLGQEDAYLAELTAAATEMVVRFEAAAEGEGRAAVDRDGLRSQHPALQRRIIETLLHRLHAPANHAHILAVVELAAKPGKGRELHLGRGLRVTADRSFLLFSYPRGKGPWRG